MSRQRKMTNEEKRVQLRAIMREHGIDLERITATELRTLLCQMGVREGPLAYYERLLEKEPRHART